jgi:PIN domain nuclease of toxin-antitoxin system
MAGGIAVNLLLDTAAFLWLCVEARSLSPAAATALSDPDNTVSVSAVTGWEIGLKHAKGKLQLPARLDVWFPAMIRHHRLELLPIDARTAIASTSLPPLHGDPFDRLLVALALEHGMLLVTPDTTIPKYPKVQCLW